MHKLMVVALVDVVRRARTDGSQGEEGCDQRGCGRHLVDDLFCIASDFE